MGRGTAFRLTDWTRMPLPTPLWGVVRGDEGLVRLNTGSVTFPKGGREATFAYYDGRSLSVLAISGEVLKSVTL